MLLIQFGLLLKLLTYLKMLLIQFGLLLKLLTYLKMLSVQFGRRHVYSEARLSMAGVYS